jgi:SAM-dependent methyltransferase
MWNDAIDLRDFYASSLGKVAQRMIYRKIRSIWPDTKGLSLLGLGYATPFLGPFRSEASATLAVMPAAQGVLHWPNDALSLTTLVDETELPFPDLSVDRVLLVHLLETTEHIRPTLREIWRVLSPGGRLLVVAPNRRGLWARFERTPFGHGRPYSGSQLSRLLRMAMFTPLQTHKALYVPPTQLRMVLSSAAALERIGRHGLSTFAGIVMVEATKQIYAANAELQGKGEKVMVPLVQGMED